MPSLSYPGFKRLGIHDLLPLVQRRQRLRKRELERIFEEKKKPIPKIFESLTDSPAVRMSSPGWQAGLWGAGVGLPIGAMVGDMSDDPVKGTLGGLAAGGLAGLIAWHRTKQRNNDVEEIMRRLPPNATLRDYEADPLIAERRRALERSQPLVKLSWALAPGAASFGANGWTGLQSMRNRGGEWHPPAPYPAYSSSSAVPAPSATGTEGDSILENPEGAAAQWAAYSVPVAGQILGAADLTDLAYKGLNWNAERQYRKRYGDGMVYYDARPNPAQFQEKYKDSGLYNKGGGKWLGGLAQKHPRVSAGLNHLVNFVAGPGMQIADPNREPGEGLQAGHRALHGLTHGLASTVNSLGYERQKYKNIRGTAGRLKDSLAVTGFLRSPDAYVASLVGKRVAGAKTPAKAPTPTRKPVSGRFTNARHIRKQGAEEEAPKPGYFSNLGNQYFNLVDATAPAAWFSRHGRPLRSSQPDYDGAELVDSRAGAPAARLNTYKPTIANALFSAPRFPGDEGHHGIPGVAGDISEFATWPLQGAAGVAPLLGAGYRTPERWARTGFKQNPGRVFMDEWRRRQAIRNDHAVNASIFSEMLSPSFNPRAADYGIGSGLLRTGVEAVRAPLITGYANARGMLAR